MTNDYTKEWYDYIDEVVMKYQDGDTSAGEEIIDAFQGYLDKYFYLIREGKINFKDRDSRNFVALYISDKKLSTSLKRKRHTTEAKAEAHRALDILQSNCASVPDEDLRQELVVALLVLAKRYKKRGPKKHFAGYVYNAYRYEIMRRIRAITSDPISFAMEDNLRYNDEANLTDSPEPDLNFIEFEQLPEVIGDELSTNWIYGGTSSEIFENLSPFERLILKLYYMDGLHDYEIAEKTGYHRNWIFRKRHKAIDHISRRLGYEEEDN